MGWHKGHGFALRAKAMAKRPKKTKIQKVQKVQFFLSTRVIQDTKCKKGKKKVQKYNAKKKSTKTLQNIPNCSKLYQDVQKRPECPILDGWSYKVDSRPSAI